MTRSEDLGRAAIAKAEELAGVERALIDAGDLAVARGVPDLFAAHMARSS